MIFLFEGPKGERITLTCSEAEARFMQPHEGLFNVAGNTKAQITRWLRLLDSAAITAVHVGNRVCQLEPEPETEGAFFVGHVLVVDHVDGVFGVGAWPT